MTEDAGEKAAAATSGQGGGVPASADGVSAAPLSSQAPLSFHDVEVRFGAHEVLRKVSFQLARGEVVGVLGSNGAGKTTLLRLASGVHEPDGGRVEFEGRSLREISRRQLARRLALVPQDLHVPFPFSAGEIVLMGRSPHQPALGFESARDVEIARAALARLGIEELADRSITQLSAGERQLVLLARALAQDPGVLLLDEPTAFLDLRHRIDVLRVVRGFTEAGGAALIVSHDLGLAARICDRLVVLCEGRVLAEGSPEDVVRPEILERAFGISADVFTAPDGRIVAIPRVE